MYIKNEPRPYVLQKKIMGKTLHWLPPLPCVNGKGWVDQVGYDVLMRIKVVILKLQNSYKTVAKKTGTVLAT